MIDRFERLYAGGALSRWRVYLITVGLLVSYLSGAQIRPHGDTMLGEFAWALALLALVTRLCLPGTERPGAKRSPPPPRSTDAIRAGSAEKPAKETAGETSRTGALTITSRVRSR